MKSAYTLFFIWNRFLIKSSKETPKTAAAETGIEFWQLPSDFLAYPKKLKQVDEHSLNMYLLSKEKEIFTDLLKSVILENPQDEKSDPPAPKEKSN